MSFLVTLIQLQWWVHVLVAMSFFTVVLILNYIVKKINESRLEERLTRLRDKASTDRSIQVQRQFDISLPTKKALPAVLEQPSSPTAKGISLVFGRENNLIEDRRNKDEVNIKNISDTKKLTIIDADDSINNATTSSAVEPLNTKNDDDTIKVSLEVKEDLLLTSSELKNNNNIEALSLEEDEKKPSSLDIEGKLANTLDQDVNKTPLLKTAYLIVTETIAALVESLQMKNNSDTTKVPSSEMKEESLITSSELEKENNIDQTLVLDEVEKLKSPSVIEEEPSETSFIRENEAPELTEDKNRDNFEKAPFLNSFYKDLRKTNISRRLSVTKNNFAEELLSMSISEQTSSMKLILIKDEELMNNDKNNSKVELSSSSKRDVHVNK